MDRSKSSAPCATEVALRAAIKEDERRQGRSLTPREREAFSRAFLAESREARGLEGSLMLADREVHHAVPQCLLRLRDRVEDTALDGEGIQAWLEFEHEARRWNVPVEIDRADLQALVEASTVVLEREKHRLLHASDWQRWGARGGRETVRRYGSSWMALIALRRWGRITPAELDAARVLR